MAGWLTLDEWIQPGITHLVNQAIRRATLEKTIAQTYLHYIFTPYYLFSVLPHSCYNYIPVPPHVHCNNHFSTDKTALSVQVSRQGSVATSGVFSVLRGISHHEITKSLRPGCWNQETPPPRAPALTQTKPQSPGTSYHVFPVLQYTFLPVNRSSPPFSLKGRRLPVTSHLLWRNRIFMGSYSTTLW